MRRSPWTYYYANIGGRNCTASFPQLPPGKYTVEVRSGDSIAKTTLKVQAEKESGLFGDDPPGEKD